jgi:hypothetical protein
MIENSNFDRQQGGNEEGKISKSVKSINVKTQCHNLVNPDSKTTWCGMARTPTRGLDPILSHMLDFVSFYRQNKLRE